jgi:integrase/recombinase XerD
MESTRFDQFINERKYLMNVSPNTIRWYRHALKWLPNDQPTDADLKAMVMRMRQAGLKPTGANAAIRAINAYLRWGGFGGGISLLKEPQLSLPTFGSDDIRKLLVYRPKSLREQRLHLLVLFLLDTGARISEALAVQWQDIDMGDMLVLLHGKGGKDRKVPISHELRKVLWRQKGIDPCSYLWEIKRCGALRAVKQLCRKLGFEPPARTLHALRHSFALNYVRHGGSVFHLQRMLGHSSLEMSRRYVNLTTNDLSQAHRSPLTM